MSVPRSTHGFGLLMQAQYAVLGLSTCWQAMLEPVSVVYHAVTVSGAAGYVLVGVLLVASLLSLADAVLYQVLHVRWPSVRRVRQMRHTSGWLIAVCWVLLLWQAHDQFATHGLLSIYGVLVAFLCASLIKDAHNEHCALRRRG